MNITIGSQVSLADDKSQEFDVFIVEAILHDGCIKVENIDRQFHPDELTIVH